MTPALANARAAAPDEASLVLRRERAEDAERVLALVEAAFGPGRYAKASERIREGNRVRADLSFCALEGDRLVGSVRIWPVTVGDEAGLFLGPIAVAAGDRRRGVARDLIAAAVTAADAEGAGFILLVGDPPIFGPHGFRRAAAVSLPGPADPARILVRAPEGRSEPHGRAAPPRRSAG